MKMSLIAATSFLALAAPLQAQDQDAQALLQSVIALEEEYDDAYADWREELMARSNAWRAAYEKDPNAPRPERLPQVEPDFWPRFNEAAAQGSTRAQMWCVEHYVPGDAVPKAQQESDFTRRIVTLLTDASAPHEKLPRAVMMRSRGDAMAQETTDALLVMIGQLASSQDVAAEAAYNRATLVDDRRGTLEERKPALDRYRAVAAAYPETKYGQRANGQVFKVERLQLGMTAPEIVGKDIDGNDMKLSDFKGKVTVLDFWGFW
ncbi:MAG: hypothetical protein ISQ11_12320 [Planctomycetes bacterium]|nr:hypothetical protein [Planctomycetota bacterium]